ncbi:Uncharacterized protein Rs2_39415 [Raphanus sativus]|nr:Uncharacterized protein Rs2_39415 [Raphanus sativus]
MNSDPRGLRTGESKGDTKGCGIAQRYYQRSKVAGCDAPLSVTLRFTSSIKWYQKLDEIQGVQQTRPRPAARRECPRRSNQSNDDFVEREFPDGDNKSQKKSTSTHAPVAEQSIFISEKPKGRITNPLSNRRHASLYSPTRPRGAQPSRATRVALIASRSETSHQTPLLRG